MKKRQVKPNAWSCSITALAMTLNIPVSEVIKEAGHDGSEIIFPSQEEPMNHRSYNSQELVRIAWRHGFAMTPVELFPRIMSNDGIHHHFVWQQSDSECWERFMKIVKGTVGILEGRGLSCPHTVHNSHGMLYDPDFSGTIYPFSGEDCKAQGFYPSRLWVFTRHSL